MANSSFFQNAVEKANKKPATTVERLAEAYNNNTQRGGTAVETPVLDNAQGSPLAPIYSKAESRESSMSSGKYADILKAGDYAELSKSGDSKRHLFGDAQYDYINNIGDFRKQADVAQAQGRGSDYGKYALMTDDEVGVYNYLYATKGKKAANAFLSDLSPELDKQWFTAQNQNTTEALGENAGTRALASAATVAMQPVRTMSSIVGGVDDAIRMAKGQEINPYSQWRQASNITQDLRADTSQHIEETNPGFGGKAGSFLYNTAMSAADSAVNMLVSKGLGTAAGLTGDGLMRLTNILGSALMSSEAASQAVADGKEKGYSNAGALALGLTRGAIEYASEAAGGEWVIRNIKADPLNFAKTMVLNMIPEGTEEVMSDAMNGAVNLVVDGLFGTEESGIPKLLNYYRENGTEWQKAHPELATVVEILGQEGLSFLGGSLSTIGSSGVQYSTNRTNINRTAERLQTTPQNVVRIMQEMKTDDPAAVYGAAEMYDASSVEDLRAKMGGQFSKDETSAAMTQPPAADKGEAVSSAASVMADILSAPVNRAQANRIINDANLRSQYESYTGEKLPAVKSEAAKAVMDYSRNNAELTPIAQTVLDQRAEAAPVSDVQAGTVSPAAQTMARAATQNAVQESAPAQTDISPAARTMADVLTGKNTYVENPYSSGDYSSMYTAADGAAIRKDAKTFRNVVAGIDTSVKDFFSRWRNGRKSHLGEKLEKLYLGKVTDAARQRISNLLGYDVTSENYIITSDGVKHVYDQHGDAGKETARGNIPLTDDIIEKLPEVLANPDSIDLGHQESRGDRSGIVFQKAFPNGTIVYIQFDNSGRGTIEGKTIYAKKAATSSGVNADASANTFTSKTTEPVAATGTDQPAQFGRDLPATGLQSANVQAPASTPETSTATPVGNQNVSQAAANVNPEGVETRLSQTVETVRDAAVTPDAVKQSINENIENGGYRYIPESNADAVASAHSEISSKGFDSVLREWTAKVNRGKTSNDLSATGAVLYNEAIRSGNTKLALDILSDYQILGTNTAQGLQAASIIKNLTPDGQLYIMQKDVKKLNDSRSETAKRKRPEGYKIDPELADAFINAKDAAARDAAVTAIQQDIASQIPASFAEKWRALRYLNMLGNVKTQARNLLGNTAMMVLTGAKNTTLTGIEYLVNKLSGGKYERSTAFGVRDYMDAAKKYYKTVDDFVNGDSKYMESNMNDSFSRGIQDARKIFGFKPLEAYRKATQWAMTQGDVLFIRPQFARSLSGYLKARGMDANTFTQIVNGDIQATTEQQNLIHNATEYAAREAQEATFHDSNEISKAVSKVGKGWPAPVRAIIEGILPFRKTPANVLVRAEEYSPLGVVNTAVNAYQAAKGLNGKTAADVINSFSKTATGTSLFALGALLAKAGLARGKEDDAEKAAFDKMQGKQDFSIVLPDGSSYTIDWLSPASVPFFMGVVFSDALSDGDITVGEFLKAIGTLTDPMIEMSMLQGVNDALDQIRYADDSLVNFAMNQMVNYVSQAIGNSLYGQIERITEKNRETTYTASDTTEGRMAERTLGKVLNKIPGLEYNQVEYVDAWGRTQSNGSAAERAFSNLLSPGYIGKNRSTEVDNELQRLYDAGQTNVFPSRISMTDTVGVYRSDGRKTEERRLTKDEYVQYQKVMGQTSLELVKDLMRSPVYKGMSDEAKASAISEIYGYAKRMAAMAVEPSAKYGEKTDVSKLSNPAAYYAANASFNTASKDSENRNYGELDSLTASFSRLPSDVRDAVTEGNAGLAKLLDARENGYNARQYFNVYDTVKSLTPAEGYTGVATWQKIDAVCSMNTPDAEKDYFVMNYFEGSSKDKYTAAREAGYSPHSVAVAYQTYQLSKGVDKNGDGRNDSGTKKAAFIAAMMEQGASKSSAEWLYKLFASNK